MATATLDGELSYSEDLDLLHTTTKPLAQYTKSERVRATLWLVSSSSYATGAVGVLFLVVICIPLGFFCVALFSHNEMPNLRTQPLTPSVVPEELVTSKKFTVAPAANNTAAAQPFKEHQMNEAEKDEKKDETFQPFESFNHTNPHKNSWCPRATCNNSPLCQPCKKRFLFIISTGRSGSTSLLSMLNYLPGVRLSGENDNELFIASHLESNLHKDNKFVDDKRNSGGAFHHNAIPSQAMACPMQQLLSTIDPPPHETLMQLNRPGHPSFEEYESSSIIGAKMIRIQSGAWGEVEAAAYFQKNFPCSRFLVNYRSDEDGQAKSALKLGWSSDYQKYVGALKRQNKFLRNFAEALGNETAQLVDMEDWTKDISILNSVVSWLGFQGCSFKSILHENHDGFGRDDSDPGFGARCRYAHK